MDPAVTVIYPFLHGKICTDANTASSIIIFWSHLQIFKLSQQIILQRNYRPTRRYKSQQAPEQDWDCVQVFSTLAMGEDRAGLVEEAKHKCQPWPSPPDFLIMRHNTRLKNRDCQNDCKFKRYGILQPSQISYNITSNVDE